MIGSPILDAAVLPVEEIAARIVTGSAGSATSRVLGTVRGSVSVSEVPDCGPQRGRHKTTSVTTTSSSRAKITLPIHPRVGEEVVVRRSHGAGIVLIETQDGGHLMVPLEWTDLKPVALLVAVSGRTVRLAPEALRELAAWIRDRGAEKGREEVGHFHKRGESRDSDGEQRRLGALTAGKPRRQGAAALVEQARSPDAARRRGGERRKRGRQ